METLGHFLGELEAVLTKLIFLLVLIATTYFFIELLPTREDRSGAGLPDKRRPHE